MKSNELRIGNFVLFEQRTEIIDGTWKLSCPTVTHYDPIPLTEEWLIKFGFEIQGEDIRHALIGENPVTEDWMLKIINVGKGWFYKNGFHKIEYVHQLQNLYFALTGTELTIVK